MIQTSLKHILADRGLLALLVVILLGVVAYCIYIAVSLQPNDIPLAIRYTSFGDTQYYREKWYYLVSFIGFGVVFGLAHIAMIIKLHAIEMKQLAFGLAWLSLVMLVMMFIYTYSVLGVAYLS